MSAIWPHGDPRDVARAIVAEPRFGGTTAIAPPGPTLLERALSWVFDRLRDLVHTIGHVIGGPSPIGALIGIVIALAILAGLAVAVVWFARLPGRTYAGASGGYPLQTPERVLTSRELRARARALAAAERWHDAATALVQAALLALDETGRLRFDPARTAREARRIVHDAEFDAFEREANAALFAAGAATPDRFALLATAYARTFGEAV